MQRLADGTHGRGRDIKEMLERANSLEELEELDDLGIEDDTDGTDVRLSDDDVFEILYSRFRREILAYLKEQDGTSTVSDLAEHIAAKENETTIQQLSSYQRKRAYIGLYQNHLPKMDDLGVVEYDKNRGTVRLRKCASQLEPYLRDADDSGLSRITLGGSVVLATVISLGVLNVGAFAAVSDQVWIALGVAGLFGFIALDAYDRI